MKKIRVTSEDPNATPESTDTTKRQLLTRTAPVLAGTAALLAIMKSNKANAISDTLPWFQPADFTGASVQNALDAAHNAGGGLVFLAAGIYTQNYIFKIYDNIHIMGAGRGSTIIQPVTNVTSEPGHAASFCFIASKRSSIQGVTVDLSSNRARYLNGISLLPSGSNYDGDVCSNCVIEDCEVLGWDTHQYLIWNMRAQNSRIRGNFLDGGVINPTNGSDQTGIEIFGGYNVLVDGNSVKNVGGVGIYPSPSIGVPNTENVNIHVFHNQIENCGTGIQAQSCFDDANGVQRLENLNIHDNQINSCFQTGIALYAAQPECIFKNIQISDNQISNTPIGLINDFQADIPSENQSGIVWRDNQVDACGGGRSGGAFHITRLRNAQIEGNSVTNSNAASAYFLLRCEDIKFSSNKIDGSNRSALILQDCSSCIFNDNALFYYNQEGPYNAISLQAVTNSIFTHNSFKPAIESYCLQGGPDSFNLTITSNYFLYTPTFSSPITIPGDSPNQGVALLPSGASSVWTQNSKVTLGSRIQVTQIGGSIIGSFKLSIINGGFSIVLPTIGDGTQQFRWEIIQ